MGTCPQKLSVLRSKVGQQEQKSNIDENPEFIYILRAGFDAWRLPQEKRF